MATVGVKGLIYNNTKPYSSVTNVMSVVDELRLLSRRQADGDSQTGVVLRSSHVADVKALVHHRDVQLEHLSVVCRQVAGGRHQSRRPVDVEQCRRVAGLDGESKTGARAVIAVTSVGQVSVVGFQ